MRYITISSLVLMELFLLFWTIVPFTGWLHWTPRGLALVVVLVFDIFIWCAVPFVAYCTYQAESHR